jgi:DNA-binding transcriptional LysR family regulator
MTLRRLEIFAAVVEAGGFRACSDALDISPAAVSHQVSQLEEAIGCALFIRRRGRVCGLTDDGKRVHEQAKGLLDHARSFESLMAGLGRAAKRRIIVLANPILEMHLAKHIAGFAAEHPSIEVSLQRAPFEEMPEALEQRRADLAYFYSTGPVSAMASERAWLEPVSLCARHDHPIVAGRRATWQSLRRHAFVMPPAGTHFRRCIDALLRRRGGGDYRTALETGHPSIAREAVIGGLAASAVISRYLEDDLIHHGVHAVAAFEGQLVLEVRRAERRNLAIDRPLAALIRRLNEAAPLGSGVRAGPEGAETSGAATARL